jgi:GNAT superfamily N-acetyltransferase
MAIIRPAGEADLPAAYDAFYQTEVHGDPNPPPPGSNAELRHVFHTGRIYVAEVDGKVIGFGGAVSRGNQDILTDLFVQPGAQSSGLGKALLDHVLPPAAGRVRSTFSSSDHRAHSLYTRHGLRPLWPHYCLAMRGMQARRWPDQDVAMVETSPHDPELLRWDAGLSGSERRLDFEYWARDQRAAMFWLERAGRRVGYGVVRLNAGTLAHPDSCEAGPVGVARPEDAAACALAVAHWAADHAPRVLINVPGPHPALAPLLAVGFHITYVETFHSEAESPTFDTRRYIASGSMLV